jgi:uncharacterized protein (DUF169 family)
VTTVEVVEAIVFRLVKAGTVEHAAADAKARRTMTDNPETIPTDTRWAHHSAQLVDGLGLATEPVAVWLLRPADDPAPFAGFDAAASLRFCQALMRARHGDSVLVQPSRLACPAAARAFGFRDLPPALESGEALVGFGIVSDAATGRTMFEAMPRLAAGALVAVAAAPLAKAPRSPDVIVVEGPPEALMWLALADLNRAGGVRRHGDTAVLQATCVDATIVPYLEQRLNFSLGCYGCREATDLGPEETVLGFPVAHLDGLVDALERLRATAMPRSRAKKPYEALLRARASAGDRES